MEIVLVTHNFDAKENDEISIRAGETIQVIEKDEAFLDGWWRVSGSALTIVLFDYWHFYDRDAMHVDK